MPPIRVADTRAQPAYTILFSQMRIKCYDTLRSPIIRCAGPLLPSLNVHAYHDERQGERSFPDEAGHLDAREQTGREPRCKKVCETVGQVAETPDRHQHTHYSGKEGRPEHQVSDREAIESKKYEGEVEAFGGGGTFSFEVTSYFSCFFICFNLGSLVRMRRYKIIAFACPCPSPMSDLSHARSSECFATILPFFTNPFLLANAKKSSGDLPVFAWMLSRYALNVTSPHYLLGSLKNHEKRF